MCAIGVHSRAYHHDPTVAAGSGPEVMVAFQAALDRQRPEKMPPVANPKTPRGRALAPLGFSTDE